MPHTYQSLTHPGIQTLEPYVPGKSIEAVKRELGLNDIIKLASNENPFGCSPLVFKTLSELKSQDIANYPAYNLHPLKQALAQKYGISEDLITLSNGSDFIFTLLLMLFALGTNKHMLTHDKAFSTYAIQAKTLGIPFVSTPLLANWQVDVSALIAACNENTGLIFLANPNNPTGLIIPIEDLQLILESIPKTCILVIDEAYYEFAYAPNDSRTLQLFQHYSNLVITRTFSKAYGLAGLRIGYAIACKEITELLQRIQLPFMVNQVALEASLSALQDEAFLTKILEQNKKGLEQVRLGLHALHLKTLESHCNFITFDCGQNSLPIYQELLKYGIIVRPLTPYQLPNFLRVSIGREEDNERFLKALSQVLKHKEL